MSEAERAIWIAVLGAVISLTVAVVGVVGSFLTAQSAARTAKEVAERTAHAQRQITEQTLEGQRILARDAARRTRRERAVESVLTVIREEADIADKLGRAAADNNRESISDLTDQLVDLLSTARHSTLFALPSNDVRRQVREFRGVISQLLESLTWLLREPTEVHKEMVLSRAGAVAAKHSAVETAFDAYIDEI